MKHEDLNKNRTPAGFTRLSKLNKIKAKTKKKKTKTISLPSSEHSFYFILYKIKNTCFSRKSNYLISVKTYLPP